MRQEQYPAAVESYTQAIQLDSRNAVYYCNRSVCIFLRRNNTQFHNQLTTDSLLYSAIIHSSVLKSNKILLVEMQQHAKFHQSWSVVIEIL